MENSLWKRLCTCRKTDYVVVIVVMVVVMMMMVVVVMMMMMMMMMMVMMMMCINRLIYFLEAQCECLSVLQSRSRGFRITSPFRGNILCLPSKVDMSQIIVLGFVKILNENITFSRNVRIRLPTDAALYPKTTETWETVCFSWGRNRILVIIISRSRLVHPRRRPHAMSDQIFFLFFFFGFSQQAEVAQWVPGRLRPRIFLTFGTTRVVGRQPYAPASFTPGEIRGNHF